MNHFLVYASLAMLFVYPAFAGFVMAVGFWLILSRLKPAWIWIIPLVIAVVTLAGVFQTPPPPDGPTLTQKLQLIVVIPVIWGATPTWAVGRLLQKTPRPSFSALYVRAVLGFVPGTVLSVLAIFAFAPYLSVA